VKPLSASLPAVALAVALLLAGCGDDGDSAADDTTTTTTEAASSTTSEQPPSTETTPESSTTTTTEAPAPEPLADQTPPIDLNGIEVDGDTLWIASIDANQVLQIDRISGAILTRITTGTSGPDDVTVGPDGATYWTGFADGSVGRIEDGVSTTIANVGVGANPIGFTPAGELIVGRAVTADGIFRVPLDGGDPEPIVEVVGDMNAFVVEADRVVGPVGGVAGPGGVSAVDLGTGEVTELGSGFDVPVIASDTDPDGVLHLLSFSGQVWRFDEATGTIEIAHTVPLGIYDNLSFADDGTLYVSHFTEPVVTVVALDGTISTLAVGG
jgi:hypothetical protein